MREIDFKNAYYIKLGRSGMWEKSSLEGNIVRFGWKHQSLDDINQSRWEVIGDQLRKEIPNKGAAKRDLQSLRNIVESTSEDVWITFSSCFLWWCKLAEKEVFEDKISKYRRVKEHWHNTDVNGAELLINRIPGNISKTQRYAGTVCRVQEIDTLRRLLNAQSSKPYQEISSASEELYSKVETGLKLLHWKDFEVLIDLLFRSAGWRRISVIGETMKFADIELEEPINKELYQVQIKSEATVEDFIKYKSEFSDRGYRKLFFIVHSPQGNTSRWQSEINDRVELIFPDRLAKMVVNLGLLEWLLNKIK
jgi:hypothetical protein